LKITNQGSLFLTPGTFLLLNNEKFLTYFIRALNIIYKNPMEQVSIGFLR